MSRWMIYGASGYTGQLIAEEAVSRGHKPVLAGRSEAKVRPLAEKLGCEWKAVPLDDPGSLRAALDGVGLVVHAAGPFVYTSAPMVRACLDVGAHYTDITGELSVFEAVFAMDEAAQRRGISLVSGIGFDVIPTDCMAVHVASRVKHPRKLEMAIAAIGNPSGGTARTIVEEILPKGIRARREGKLVSIPPLKGGKKVRFSRREAWVVPAPLADLETAFHSTGIEDITMYIAAGSNVAKVGRVIWPFAAVTMPLVQAALRAKPVREKLGALAHERQGPDAAARESGRSYIWARAEGSDGAAEATLETLEGYELTRIGSVRTVEKILATRPRGAKSPAQVLGADFVLELPNTVRADL